MHPSLECPASLRMFSRKRLGKLLPSAVKQVKVADRSPWVHRFPTRGLSPFLLPAYLDADLCKMIVQVPLPPSRCCQQACNGGTRPDLAIFRERRGRWSRRHGCHGRCLSRVCVCVRACLCLCVLLCAHACAFGCACADTQRMIVRVSLKAGVFAAVVLDRACFMSELENVLGLSVWLVLRNHNT